MTNSTPADQTIDQLSILSAEETCPICRGKKMGWGEFCIAGCRRGTVFTTTANVLRNIKPWLQGVEDERDALAIKLARANIALTTCKTRFEFYANEHFNAGKFEKAASNQMYADICFNALDPNPNTALNTPRQHEREAAPSKGKRSLFNDICDRMPNILLGFAIGVPMGVGLVIFSTQLFLWSIGAEP